jgi:hypothetical protein
MTRNAARIARRRDESTSPNLLALRILFWVITRRKGTGKVLDFGHLDVFYVSQFLITNYPL